MSQSVVSFSVSARKTESNIQPMTPRPHEHWAFLESSPPPTGLAPLCLCTADIGPVLGWEVKLPGARPPNTACQWWATLLRSAMNSAMNPASSANCVATVQGHAGSWNLCRRKNIHGAVGMSGMPLFMGGQATHAASCVSICMSHVMALAPECGTHRGTCPLACLPSSLPPAGSPYLFEY